MIYTCPSCRQEVQRLIKLSPVTSLCIRCALESGVLTEEEVKLLVRQPLELVVDDTQPWRHD